MEGNQNTAQVGQNQTNSLGQNTTNQSQTQSQTQVQVPQPSQTWPQGQVSQQPVVQPSSPVKNSSMKNTFLLIIVLIAAVILMLVVYISLANRQSNISPNSPPIYPTITTVPTQTDAQELDGIDIGDVDNDLKEVDTDIEGL